MSRVIWVETAELARDEAIEYIALSNIKAALQQFDEIRKQTWQLLRFPNLGRPNRRRKGMRDLSINRTPFVVTYRIIGDSIQIVYFRHTSRKI